MLQHALKLYNCLHPQDVGAVTDRPRAWCSAQRIEISILAGGKYTLIHDNRPYKFPVLQQALAFYALLS